jgi:hypothetical protein
MLLDTCFGARVTKSSDEGYFIKEILSATGFHDSDLAPSGPKSFTRCLVKALESGVGDQTPTVYNLHAHLSASRKYPMEPYHGWFSGSPIGWGKGSGSGRGGGYMDTEQGNRGQLCFCA